MWVTVGLTTPHDHSQPLCLHLQIPLYGHGRGKRTGETAISMLTAHMWPEGWKMKLRNGSEISKAGVPEPYRLRRAPATWV